jgi:membrane-associated phospholipid phosphatase
MGRALGSAPQPLLEGFRLAQCETSSRRHGVLKLPDFNRARPYQVYPSLDPPFTPGHASYPSGHATQSHAIAKVIELVLKTSTGQFAQLIAQCLALADEIALNHIILRTVLRVSGWPI